MKEPFSFEPGRVVESTQGRDKGNCFLILEQVSEDIVMIPEEGKDETSARKTGAAEPEGFAAGRRSAAEQRSEKSAGRERFCR